MHEKIFESEDFMMERIENSQTEVHRSPPLGIVAVVFVLLFAASIATNMIMTGGAPYPNPYLPLEQLQDYYTRFPEVMRLTSFLQFGASIPLGIFAATVVSCLLFHRVRVAGVYIALFGGLAAAIFLGISALTTWGLSQPGVATDIGAMRAVQLLAFATGGVGHTVTLGLLLAGASVPGLAFRLVPRWVSWSGLIIAAIAILSVLSMVFPALSILLPLGRFPAYLWLIALGFTLPKHRQSVDAPSREVFQMPEEQKIGDGRARERV
jgi:hypothetical protein